MAVFKCKMCGAVLNVEVSQTVAECRYCGTTQTLPRLDNERRTNMLDRANHYRRNSEYDKAAAMYEQLLAENATDAEVYWCLVLCRYGIEYVKDPVTQAHVPTVNRAQYTSVFDDINYKAALQYADLAQRMLYEREAAAINEIHKGILAISQREEPFDVFICYKESDQSGQRTRDSVIAQDLYYQLVREGFKVFFSRISLENKLGTAYEPYIFAALNSAKVMVVVGTCAEHFEAVWVKNEWSRYLSLIKNGADKILIPAYRDMDPYDLPQEFSHLQAQDMSRLGFMQDLVHGIRKIVYPAKQEAPPASPVAGAPFEAAPMLRRAAIFLEDGAYNRANELCEQVLNHDPENAQAYLYQLCAVLKCCRVSQLESARKPLENYNAYHKVIRFGDAQTVDLIRRYNQQIVERRQFEEREKHERQEKIRRERQLRAEQESAFREKLREKRRLEDEKYKEPREYNLKLMIANIVLVLALNFLETVCLSAVMLVYYILFPWSYIDPFWCVWTFLILFIVFIVLTMACTFPGLVLSTLSYIFAFKTIGKPLTIGVLGVCALYVLAVPVVLLLSVLYMIAADFAYIFLPLFFGGVTITQALSTAMVVFLRKSARHVQDAEN